jgi:two-component system, response regulator PdtaR
VTESNSLKVSNKHKVLIVEDEELIRMNTVDMIRDFGFEVIEAVDADQAVDLLESISGIEVVFTDIQMPGSMNGLLLAAVVRHRWPPVALLIASGRERPSAADMPPGARFIPKPYSRHELRQHLYALAG